MHDNITDIEDHPRYQRQHIVIGGHPLSELDLAGLLLFINAAGAHMSHYWYIVEPDGTRKPVRHRKKGVTR